MLSAAAARDCYTVLSAAAPLKLLRFSCGDIVYSWYRKHCGYIVLSLWPFNSNLTQAERGVTAASAMTLHIHVGTTQLSAVTWHLRVATPAVHGALACFQCYFVIVMVFVYIIISPVP